VLGGSLLTVAFLLAAIGWVFSRSVLTTDIPMPEYRGLSLPVCYCRVLYAGFVNLTWVIAVAGVVLVWLLAVRRGQASKRLALGISLILLHRWLQLTLVFLLMFGRFKT
jgi:predicted ferric reductase